MRNGHAQNKEKVRHNNPSDAYTRSKTSTYFGATVLPYYTTRSYVTTAFRSRPVPIMHISSLRNQKRNRPGSANVISVSVTDWWYRWNFSAITTQFAKMHRPVSIFFAAIHHYRSSFHLRSDAWNVCRAAERFFRLLGRRVERWLL